MGNWIIRRENLHHKGGQTLQGVAQRGCGISTLSKDTKNLAGQALEQPGLIRPDSKGMDKMTSRVISKQNYSMIL